MNGRPTDQASEIAIAARGPSLRHAPLKWPSQVGATAAVGAAATSRSAARRLPWHGRYRQNL